MADTNTTDKQYDASACSFPAWLLDFKIQATIIALLSFIFYFNTISNEYALDDTVVIVQNEFVLEGLQGIPGILTKDGYYSYYRQLSSSDQVPGGRYRPLSIITFAIEQQFFGAISPDRVDSVLHVPISYEKSTPYEQHFIHDMHIRHFFNVLWFTISVVVLLYFLRYIVFKSNPVMAFLAAVLFTIHPLHTEVVANVKSRDEILSLLFICLTFIFAFKYRELKKKWQLGAALVSLFLALLSKEYAATLVVLLPLAFYLFNKETLKKSAIAFLPYVAVIAVYVFIRLTITNGMPPRSEFADNDIQINPYALASPNEKLATEISTALNYLNLLVFPNPLSSDYSYNQIPYKDFSHPVVWLSLFVHLGLFAGFFYFLKRRSALSFAIAFYLLNLLLVCNIIFDIGATMGERLIYHASVGFAIAVAYLLHKGMEMIKPERAGKLALGGLMLIITVLCGFKTIERNKDWKNDYTLFSQDINAVPNSFLVNANVATTLVNRSDFEKNEQKRLEELHRGVALFRKVIAMQNNYTLGYMNLSVAYLKLDAPDSMMMTLNKVRELYPIHPQLPEMYFYCGQDFFSHREYNKADTAYHIVLQLRPDFVPARRALMVVDSMRGRKL
jgi:protein O-mannosyl-transferase